MTTYIIIGIIVAAFGAFIYWLKTRDRTQHYINLELQEFGINNTYTRFKYNYKTPKGAEVISTAMVPPDALATVDEGIQKQIDCYDRLEPTWANYKNVSDYGVLFINPMATNQETEPGSPALLVNGYQTAGTCVGVHPRSNLKKSWIVLPHQTNTNWRFREYLKQSARNESEHVREYRNDYGRFLIYATGNDSHPHAPDENGN